MSFFGSTEFFFEVSKGDISGHTAVVVGGRNPDADSAAAEDIWEAGGMLSYLTSAERMNIVSTDTNDDGSPAGTGARTVTIAGLDGSHAEISETVTMDGTTNVLTTNSYLRVRSLTVDTAGSLEANAGTITATAETAATVQCQIGADDGVSQNSHYTVPTTKTAHVVGVQLFVAKTSAGTLPVVEFVFRVLSGGVKLTPIRIKFDTAVDSIAELTQPVQSVLTAESDIRIEVSTDQNNTDVHTRMYIIEVDD